MEIENVDLLGLQRSQGLVKGALDVLWPVRSWESWPNLGRNLERVQIGRAHV